MGCPTWQGSLMRYGGDPGVMGVLCRAWTRANLLCAVNRMPFSAPTNPGPDHGLQAECLTYQTCTLTGR